MTEKSCQFCGLVDPNACTEDWEAELCPQAPSDGPGTVIESGPFAGLLRNHYKAVVADNPWTFDTRSDAGKGRSPEMHYDCMTLEDIKALPLHEIAAPDCALFLWTLDTHRRHADEVIEAWGFTYKTRAFCWVKLNKKFEDYPAEKRGANGDDAYFKGQGFWTRANPEDCLLATRGRPKRRDSTEGRSVRRLITSPLREHSRKPDEVLERVEALVDGPYLEMFSRTSRPGWHQMGNETGKFDQVDPEIEALI